MAAIITTLVADSQVVAAATEIIETAVVDYKAEVAAAVPNQSLVPVVMTLTSTKMSNDGIDMRVMMPVMSLQKMSIWVIIIITIMNRYPHVDNMIY